MKKSETNTEKTFRQGDLVIHRVERQKVGKLKRLATNVLAAGDSTSLKHRFLPAASGRLYDLGGGFKLLRVLKRLRLEHQGPDGHPTIKLDLGDHVVGPLCNYDRDHGWVAVTD